ncbi:ABC transporter substrate-binding protein [Aliidongia dinghuensis]|uniref:ABC transporter substrate-binding protein n=1 Tax=Aliidongia dinghuensis TaxID=1867774 RepID=A0A8J2YSS6_9PROT|nr:transporter substrate-binding domain-containing protein [Aliidongia dinghuensis]GGF14684.1 ABC transporter substrate-binding protein [Aliidongia dinghuensis]
MAARRRVQQGARLALAMALLPTATLSAGSRAWAAGTRPCERVVVSGDADYEPLSWFDGREMQGAAETIVGAALGRIGVPFEMQYVGPFKRVLADAEVGDVDVVAELKKTPEREAFMAFSSTPIFVNPVAIFTHRARHLKLARREDLVGLRGGIVIANQFGGDLDAFINARLSVEEVPRLDLGLKMLAEGRLDYFITSYYPGMTYLLDQGWETAYTIQQPYIVATDNFVGISRQSRCFAELQALDRALAEMAREGEIARLFDAATADWRRRAAQSE